jgi:hypothetical protein
MSTRRAVATRRKTHRLPVPVALVAGIAAMVVGWALVLLPAPGAMEHVTIGSAPATVYLPRGGAAQRGPTVVIAHGFAGSQQLMAPFALALAQGGYRAITFDFPGHGQHDLPMANAGREARYRQLSGALAEVVRYAQGRFGGPIGLLGHSMGSEVVTRYAQSSAEIEATVAVSLVYEGVTAASPRNLLVLTGAWEPGLIPLAQAVADSAAGGAGATEVTYGAFAEGTARRVVLVPWVEHVGVLFAPASLTESYRWFQGAMPAGDGSADLGGAFWRTPGVGLIFAGAILLFWPLAALLRPIGPLLPPAPPLSRRAWWLVAGAPALLAPLVTLLVPAEGLLPILVGGPLALFFAAYGGLTLAGLALARAAARRGGALPERPAAEAGDWRRRAAMALAVALLAFGYVLLTFGVPAQAALLNYFPPPPRWPVFLAVLAAMLPYFLADELLTRGPGAPRGAYLITKVSFLAALAAAIALNPGALFFLVLVAPIFVAYFAAYGLLSGLMARRTGTVAPAVLANSAIFAWAVAAVFPLVA